LSGCSRQRFRKSNRSSLSPKNRMTGEIQRKKLKTIVLGIGNPILRDDSVGLKVARAVKRAAPEVEVVETAEAGLSLLEWAPDHDRLIVIDSIKAAEGEESGEVFKLDFATLDPAMDFTSFHGVDIVTAFELGKRLSYQMPQSVSVYAITVRENRTFTTECSDEVERKIPAITGEILKEENL
jgi:hydrogenase maturation protease